MFFLKKDTIIDIITICPPILNIILESHISIGFLRMLRMLKVMRIVRIFRMMNKTGNNANEGICYRSFYINPVQIQVIILILNLFTTVFISAGIVMLVDNIVPDSFSSEMKFIDAIYFMIMTSGTIGFGDYVPVKTVSRITIMIIIVTIISVFGN